MMGKTLNSHSASFHPALAPKKAPVNLSTVEPPVSDHPKCQA